MHTYNGSPTSGIEFPRKIYFASVYFDVHIMDALTGGVEWRCLCQQYPNTRTRTTADRFMAHRSWLCSIELANYNQPPSKNKHFLRFISRPMAIYPFPFEAKGYRLTLRIQKCKDDKILKYIRLLINLEVKQFINLLKTVIWINITGFTLFENKKYNWQPYNMFSLHV